MNVTAGGKDAAETGDFQDIIDLELYPINDQAGMCDIIQNGQTKHNRLNETTPQELTTKNDILK